MPTLPTFSPFRAACVLLLVGCGLSALVGRVVYLQTYGREQTIRQAELARALSRLGPLGERERETLEALTQAIVNKLLHAPTVRLKARAGEDDGRRYAPAVRALFQLAD